MSACKGHSLHIRRTNSLTSEYPEIAKEWHPEKNGSLEPNEILSGSHKRIWWICSDCDNEWIAPCRSRSQGYGCPHCNKGTLHSDGRNSMRNTHPKLAKEFHPTKNGEMAPENIVAGSQKIWWICSICEHEWMNTSHRSKRNQRCPVCVGRSVHSDGRNSMRNTHPELAEEFHPTKNGK